jgi:CBS domain-containing protein
MNANFRRTPEPLSSHLLLRREGFAALNGTDPIALWPWRLRQEAVSNPDQGADSSSTPLAKRKSADPMTVAEVMTRDVVSVSTATPVSEVANVLAGKRFSAVPVVDVGGRLVGIVSESDLIRRAEIGTERRRSWWQKVFPDAQATASDYVRTHGRKAQHVLTSRVVTATEHMTLSGVADLMEKHRLKRLPVVRGDVLVGIVSRSDLVRAVARHRAPLYANPPTDDAILRDLMERVDALAPAPRLINISVHRGNADIAGLVGSGAEREAILVVAENTPGVRSIQDRLLLRPRSISDDSLVRGPHGGDLVRRRWDDRVHPVGRLLRKGLDFLLDGPGPRQ